MEEPKEILGDGTKIVTDKVLGSTSGILVKPQYLNARRANAVGTVKSWVAGHGGDIYWVEHDDDKTIAVYGWMEFELFKSEEQRAAEEREEFERSG